MYRLPYIVFFLLLFQGIVYAQNYEFKPHIWKLTSISGNVRVRGAYGYGDNITVANESQTLENAMFSIGASLYTRSFIYHPNLVTLDLSGGYEPRFTKFEQIESLNDFSLKFFHGRANFFDRMNYKFQLFYNLNENFTFRENVAPVRFIDRNYGGKLLMNNKFFPGSIEYIDTEQRQREVETDRKIIRAEKTLEGNFNQDYGNKNDARIKFKRTDFENLIIDTLQSNNSQYKSLTNDVNVLNKLYFSEERNMHLQTRLNYNYFESRSILRTRYSADNVFRSELPKGFNIWANHQYTLLETNDQSNKMNQLRGTLKHQLYESLTSQFTAFYQNQNQTFYKERRTNFSVDFKYTKRIFGHSTLNLDYSFMKSLDKREGDSNDLQVYEESYFLSDSQVTLINNPFVYEETVVVKNPTGAIIFQKEIDYVLITAGNFLQVQRVPGGLIPNNSNVLIDYVYQQPGSYDLNSDNMSFGVSLKFFENAFEIYYRHSMREYEDLEEVPNLTLDYYNRNVIGSRIDFDLISAGIEYDDYAANLAPFKLLSYYVTVQGRFKKRVKYNLTMQRNDYLEFGPEKQTQSFDIGNANIFYLFNYDSNLNFSLVYRGQQVAENEAKYMTARLEYMTKIKKLSLRTNINYYTRNINREKSYSIGANIILIRSF